MDAVQFGRLNGVDLLTQAKGATGAAGGKFADLLKQGMAELEALDQEAGQMSKALMAGEPVDLHRVILAGEEAGLAFELMLSIRNKTVDAYQEIMRMQV